MRKNLFTLIALVCMTPLTFVSAQTQEEGVFNCSRSGASSASAGSTRPLSGPYVPVADDAVQLNTGLLVYKECVLRVIVDRQREAMLANYDRSVINQLNTGRDGNAYYAVDPSLEMEEYAADLQLKLLQSKAIEGVHPDIREEVKRAVAHSYITQSRRPQYLYDCGYADLKGLASGALQQSAWGMLTAISQPGCNGLFAEGRVEDQFTLQRSADVGMRIAQLGWGQGTYPREEVDQNGNRKTTVPGAILLANGLQSIQSSYVQTRSANDIGQMLNSLYAGISNQIFAGSGGLSGLSQSLGGQASYLDQAVQGATRSLNTTTSNAAINAIREAIRIEQQYNSVLTAIANLFSATITTLRSEETSCFTRIKNAVCQSGSINETTCTSSSGGATLTFVTNTSFSQKLIDASIRALATATANNINSSNQIISRLQQILSIATASPTAALAALAALSPHTSQDVSSAQQNQQTIQTSMAALVAKTTEWKESTDPAIGWCNTDNTAITDAWRSCWSGSTSACPTP